MDFTENTRLALVGAVFAASGSLWLEGSAIYGMSNDCKALSEDGGFANANQCLAGVFNNALWIPSSLKFGFEAYELTATIWKFGQIKYGDGHSVATRAMSDAMTTSLGVEVRHIGDWDASTYFLSRKRDEVKQLPVFGMNVNGSDLHFAITEREDNHTTFHLGYGPGKDTEANRKLRARDEMWTNVYFEHGGVDLKVHARPDWNSKAMYIDSHEDFEFLRTQVECYINALEPVNIPDGPMFESIGSIADAMTNYKAFQFQIYNDAEQTTLTLGVVAPFTNGQESAIDDVEIVDGLDTNPDCTFS
ncbi:hypothetical protein G7Z17_g8682 [Cylindrodendrum hubeiense]|uniref:Uncharacterized protein n=1 Tax=Cylindrodendrum hubeiense TaxID=595255 RepID=A0A9P5H329_9HYPO|nr:hypothetical protein G7Z17_g8682 [Cylindrodendrum hubeiense]